MELHPYFWDRDMYEAAVENGLVVQAFAPLGNGNMEARKRFHKEGEDIVKKGT